ncbi:MAG: plasmid pRiA4b ORF-3 family protein [Actinomycetota bacterium]|nr:plasmid pRiA4b ORF-3 family protein [Actinomycetota bacterium]
MSASAMTFRATLMNVKGVRATIEVRDDQRLADLHDGIQEAFGWLDDHLYSFWLDNRFWGDPEMEYTSPVEAEEAVHTAEVSLAELSLQAGARIAYVFDFGDDWRVGLELTRVAPADDGEYPRVTDRVGERRRSIRTSATSERSISSSLWLLRTQKCGARRCSSRTAASVL